MCFYVFCTVFSQNFAGIINLVVTGLDNGQMPPCFNSASYCRPRSSGIPKSMSPPATPPVTAPDKAPARGPAALARFRNRQSTNSCQQTGNSSYAPPKRYRRNVLTTNTHIADFHILLLDIAALSSLAMIDISFSSKPFSRSVFTAFSAARSSRKTPMTVDM